MNNALLIRSNAAWLKIAKVMIKEEVNYLQMNVKNTDGLEETLAMCIKYLELCEWALINNKKELAYTYAKDFYPHARKLAKMFHKRDYPIRYIEYEYIRRVCLAVDYVGYKTNRGKKHDYPYKPTMEDVILGLASNPAMYNVYVKHYYSFSRLDVPIEVAYGGLTKIDGHLEMAYHFLGLKTDNPVVNEVVDQDFLVYLQQLIDHIEEGNNNE